MPGADVFVDSSVLIYLHDRREPEKASIASAALKRIAEKQRARTNLQVLNEVAHVLLRKKWFDSPATVFSIIDAFGVFGKAPMTSEQSSLARLIHVRTAFSRWDSLLLACLRARLRLRLFPDGGSARWTAHRARTRRGVDDGQSFRP